MLMGALCQPKLPSNQQEARKKPRMDGENPRYVLWYGEECGWKSMGNMTGSSPEKAPRIPAVIPLGSYVSKGDLFLKKRVLQKIAT